MWNIPLGNGEVFAGSFLKGPQEGGHCPAIYHANKDFSQLLGMLELSVVIQREQDAQMPLMYLISAIRL